MVAFGMYIKTAEMLKIRKTIRNFGKPKLKRISKETKKILNHY
jgi:hypothetical protein